MRNPNRIDKCTQAFADLWKRYPDLRMGQLMSNILTEYYSLTNRDPFFIEDEEFVDFVDNLWKGNRNDKAGST